MAAATPLTLIAVFFDPENTLGDSTLRVRQFMPHPSVRALQKGELSVRLLMPRGVEANTRSALAAEGTQATTLMVTGPEAKARDTSTQGPPRVTREGSLSVAVAVEKGAIPGVQAENATRLTRLVVVGDSAFLRNDRIDTDANRRFRRCYLRIGPADMHGSGGTTLGGCPGNRTGKGEVDLVGPDAVPVTTNPALRGSRDLVAVHPSERGGRRIE